MDKDNAYRIAASYAHYLKENQHNILKVVLFGSYATGKQNSNSDIDLAIIYNKLDDKFKAQVKLLMLTPKFDTRIEPHPFDSEEFNSRNSPLINEIIKYGIEVV
ncbi:MAG TPA: nucleotidyltransferase domain-containing protein [Candidatus Kapabacteria bacterium]|nr:nucleotidyltransferase domain-containing protein [Candidatus Kapabacteria bacterium]